MITNTVLHYNILEVIGEGGMGIVYKARDLNLDRLVALKIIPPILTTDPTITERFKHEARVVAQLDHPNICTIHEFEKTDDNQFVIVMAYCQGQTIRQLLSENGQLPIDSFLDISIQIAHGVIQAHKAGIIHRDLKPSNIILTPERNIKILDFGLAGLKEDSSSVGGLDKSGTTAYMSPEQAIGNGVDERSDIWALGVIMYEMLTGQLPFNGNQEQRQIYSIIKEPFSPIDTFRSDAPKQLKDIIKKCLEKDPDQRYEKTEAITKELEKFKEREVVHSIQSKQSIARRLWPLAAAMLVILIFITTYLFFPQSNPGDSKIRIVVKPFDFTGAEKKEEWLSYGISQEIRIKLSKFSNFFIISHAVWDDSILHKASLTDISERLNVDYIVDGSVLKDNHHLGIKVHLTNPYTNAQIWRENYDSDSLLTFSTIGEIAGKIASDLRTKLTNQEEIDINRPPTENKLAYQLYLRGQAFYQLGQQTNNEHAIRLLKKAIELDSTFSIAYVGLARAYRRKVMRYDPDIYWYNTAFAMIDSALKYDAECSSAYTALGILYRQDIYMGPDSLLDAIASFKRAIELDPGNFEASFELGRLYVDVGYLDEGRRNLYQALDLNPRSAKSCTYLGWSYYLSGEIEKAREYFQIANNITPMLSYQLSLHIQEEEYTEAISKYEETLKLDSLSEWMWHDLAVVYKNAGKYPKSMEIFRNLTARYPGRKWHYFGLANALIEVGRQDEALDIYKTAHADCKECRASLMFHFNHVLALQRIGKTKRAREILNAACNANHVKLTTYDNSMERIIQFCLGQISADSVEQVMAEASKKIQRQSYLNDHYFYLAMAYLYNLKPEYVLTEELKERAIDHLKRYESKAIKHDVEFSLARVELKKLSEAYK